MVNTFNFFSYSSGLKPNLTKSEIAGIRVLKGVQVAVCCITCIDLKNDTLKILGTYFSDNKKLKEENKILRLQHIFNEYQKYGKRETLHSKEKPLLLKQ